MNTLYLHRKRYPSRDDCEYFPVRLATKVQTFKNANIAPFPNDFAKFIKLSTFYDYDYFSTYMRLLGDEQSYTYSTTGVLMRLNDGQSMLEYRENPSLGLSGGIIRIGFDGEVASEARESVTLLRLPIGLMLNFRVGHHLTFKSIGNSTVQFETATKVCENTITPYNGKLILDSDVTVLRKRKVRFRYEVEVFPDTSAIPTLDPSGGKLYYIMPKKVTSE